MLRFLALLVCASLTFAQQPLPNGAFARLGGTALRHPEKPIALAFRPGTRELASLGTDGTVRVWDTTTGKELHLLRKKDHHANAMVFSENGAFLAIHFGERQLWLYNPAKKYETATFANVPQLESLTVTNDGKFVAGMRQGEPMMIEVSGDAREMTLPEGTAVAVAPDGKSVAVARKDAETSFVDVLEVPSGKRMLRMVRPGRETAAITSVAYAPDSRTLAMASEGEAPIVIFQLGKEEPLAKFEGAGPVAWANEKLLVGTRSKRMAVWDVAGKSVFENLGNFVAAFCLSSDNKLAATDFGGLLGSPRILLWKNDSKQHSLIFGEERISGVLEVRSHASSGIVASTLVGEIHWLAKSDVIEKVETIKKVAVQIKAASLNGKLKIAVDTSRNGKIMFVPILDNEPQGYLESPSQSIHTVAVHPEGGSFVVIGRDGFVRAWNPEGKELWTARVARSLRAGIAYSPDGKTIVATSVVKVSILDSETGKELDSIGRQWEDGPFTSVCFNHDGSLFAVGTQGANGAGLVFETVSKGLVKRCEASSGSVIGVAFSGKTDDLVTAHADDSLLAWHTHTPANGNADPAKLWTALAGKDAGGAWPAMMELVGLKEKAAAVIAEGLKVEAKTDAEKLRKQRAEVVMKRIGAMK
jgi:WD40 repeat protein